MLALYFLLFPGLPAAKLATKTQMPEFFPDTQWLNTNPLTRKDLEGRVVLITFWNYTSVPCLKQLARLKTWQTRYLENHFQVIAIHTPYYSFEKFPENVQNAVKKLGISLPVAVDSEGLLWQAYNRPAKPGYFIVDGRGRIRARSPEKPEEAKEKAVLEDLLREQGETLSEETAPVKEIKESTATGEITFGSRRLSRFGNETRPRAEIPFSFKLPADLKTGFFYLSGAWTLEDEKAVALQKGSSLTIPFQGSRVFLIAGSPRNNPLRARIRIDGQPLTKKTLGLDAKLESGAGIVEIKDDRLYEAAANLKPGSDHRLEVTLEDPDAFLYAAVFE